MKINFTGGLVKIGNSFINPAQITKFERRGYYTDIYLRDSDDAMRINTEANKFADIFIKTQKPDKHGKYPIIEVQKSDN